jgi:hypothetical protein
MIMRPALLKGGLMRVLIPGVRDNFESPESSIISFSALRNIPALAHVQPSQVIRC